MSNTDDTDWLDNPKVINPPPIEADPLAHWEWRARVAESALATICRLEEENQ